MLPACGRFTFHFARRSENLKKQNQERKLRPKVALRGYGPGIIRKALPGKATAKPAS